MNTAATAWLCGTPALVSPAIRPASTTPAPPGTGTAPPISPAAVITTNNVARPARIRLALTGAAAPAALTGGATAAAAGAASPAAVIGPPPAALTGRPAKR